MCVYIYNIYIESQRRETTYNEDVKIKETL